MAFKPAFREDRSNQFANPLAEDHLDGTRLLNHIAANIQRPEPVLVADARAQPLKADRYSPPTLSVDLNLSAT